MARKDILPSYLSQPAWVDLCNAIDIVFKSKVDDPTAGVYVQIDPNGAAQAGSFEGALPHIGDACFMPRWRHDFGSFAEAFARAAEQEVTANLQALQISLADPPLAGDHELALADQRQRHVGQRCQVARRPHRTLAGHERHEARVGHRQQGVDHHRPHAGMAAGQAGGLQREHQPQHRRAQRFAHAHTVRADQVQLQRGQVGLADAGGGQLAEAGVHAVDRCVALGGAQVHHGGHTHALHTATGEAFYTPSGRSEGRLGVLTVAEGSTAVLAHPEHGFMAFGPGTYTVTRQREQADVILTPTAPTAAYPLSDSLPPLTEYAMDIMTLPASLAGRLRAAGFADVDRRLLSTGISQLVTATRT